MEYSEKELNIVCDSCCSTFLLIGMSDNKIHSKEEELFLNSYQKILSNLHIISDPKERVVLEFWAQERFTHEHIELMKIEGKTTHLSNIKAGLKLVRKKENDEDYHQYKVTLLNLGIEIAKSTRRFWGLGKDISVAEHTMLKELSQYLKLPLPRSAF